MNFSKRVVKPLGEIIDLVIDYRGKTPKKLGGEWSENGYKALSAKNIKTGKIVQHESIRYVDNKMYRKWMKDEIEKGDILITSEAPFGEVYYWDSDEKIVLSQRLFGLRIKRDIYPRYIYYYMTTDKFQSELDSRATGTTVRGLRQPELLKCEIELPPLSEQKAIADILSALDEKMEVNNQINKTLENMAQEIFKQWFVDFEFLNEEGEPYKSSGGEMVESELGLIPRGWEVRKLKEFINLINKSTKPGNHLKERKYNPIDTLPKQSVAIIGGHSYLDAKSSLILFEKYDILVGAMRVYFHRVNLAPYQGITRTTTFVLRSKEIEDVAFNLFLINLDKSIEYASNTSKGSTMPYAVWENGLGEMRIALPNKYLRKEYSKIVFPMLEKIMGNSREIILLQNIRDNLLPKLLSGEIRIPSEN